MELDKRIKEGKRPLTCFDLKEAEKFEGKEGYFSDCPRDFADGEISIEQCATKGILELDERSDNCPYINKTTCLDYPYFLPAEWVKEPEECVEPYRLDEKEIIRTCYLSLLELNKVLNRQNSLLSDVCNQSPVDVGHKAMTWHMRDTVKEAVDGFKHLLEDFEKGNY